VLAAFVGGLVARKLKQPLLVGYIVTRYGARLFL
jgi:predicted Kef-type K+ transport protein